jgi:hypothetical protein
MAFPQNEKWLKPRATTCLRGIPVSQSQAKLHNRQTQ